MLSDLIHIIVVDTVYTYYVIYIVKSESNMREFRGNPTLFSQGMKCNIIVMTRENY